MRVDIRLGLTRLRNSLFRRRSTLPRSLAPSLEPLRLPCRADLWCRKRTSVSTMLDPDLFELYMTGVDRIDEDWIVQSNPPCAFKSEFTEGCDALWELLQDDPELHATKGWLTFAPRHPFEGERKAACLEKMARVVRTAERELRI